MPNCDARACVEFLKCNFNLFSPHLLVLIWTIVEVTLAGVTVHAFSEESIPWPQGMRMWQLERAFSEDWLPEFRASQGSGWSVLRGWFAGEDDFYTFTLLFFYEICPETCFTILSSFWIWWRILASDINANWSFIKRSVLEEIDLFVRLMWSKILKLTTEY